MTDRPWMPLDIDDYLADTTHLTVAEHGAYMLLIMRYWKDGGLPEDERMIHRFSRLSAEQWQESRDVLAAFFSEGWKHRRIDAEIAKASDIIEKRRSAAKAKHAGKPHASAEQVQSKSTDAGVPPVTLDISSSLRSDDERERRPANPIIVLQSEVDAVVAQRWVTHCQDKGKRPSAAQVEELCGVLREVRALGGNPSEALKLAIKRGWVSLEIEYLRNQGFPFKVAAPPPTEDWSGRIAAWNQDRTWIHAWGPKPGERGCRVPRDLLERIAA